MTDQAPSQTTAASFALRSHDFRLASLDMEPDYTREMAAKVAEDAATFNVQLAGDLVAFMDAWCDPSTPKGEAVDVLVAVKTMYHLRVTPPAGVCTPEDIRQAATDIISHYLIDPDDPEALPARCDVVAQWRESEEARLGQWDA